MSENTVQWVEVVSSQITRIGYVEEKEELHIEFKGGSKYYYKDVSKEVYDDMVVAESVGKYFYANIKGVYEFVKYDAGAPGKPTEKMVNYAQSIAGQLGIDEPDYSTYDEVKRFIDDNVDEYKESKYGKRD